jgi:hypothetical protein
MRRRHVSLSITAFTAGALSVAPISGLVADGQDDWHYQAMLYFWTAGIEGETAGGAEVDVGFDTLINNLNMAFMGAFEARKARWSLRADLVHLNVGADDRGTVPVRVTSGSAVELDVSANVETKGWVIDLSAAYNLIDTERASLAVLVGARYLDLTLDFDLGLAGAGYGLARTVSASQSSWDGILGVTGRVVLDGRWYLPYHLDAGAGEADFTWQAAGGIGYAFDWGDVTLLYRHLAWEFDSGSAVGNINFSGPLLAATWRF